MIKKRKAQRDEVIGEGGHGGRGQYYNRIYPGSLIHILSVFRRVKYAHIISERTSQRIRTSITRKFVSCNFSMDQLVLCLLGGDDLSFDSYLSYKYKWMI